MGGLNCQIKVLKVILDTIKNINMNINNNYTDIGIGGNHFLSHIDLMI